MRAPSSHKNLVLLAFIIGTLSCFLLTNAFVIPKTTKSTTNRQKNTKLLHDVRNNDEQLDLDDDSSSTTTTSPSTTSYGRRYVLTAIATTASSTLFYNQEEANAATTFPFLKTGEPRKTSLSVISNRANSTSATAIRQPTKEPAYDKELAAESCLLELLPTKNKAFRNLEKELLKVSILRDDSNELPKNETFAQVTNQLNKTLQYLDDQRIKLAPVFNIDDSTVLSIDKALRGEFLLENLRNEIVSLQRMTTETMDVQDTLAAQKRSLRALAEVGELLVESFPYDVPTEGKFSFLPRLLGRAKITFTVTRPAAKKGGGKDAVLGNVTVLADGFAAPITAGNFVDLSARGFYTGLPVKAMKKRLGAMPTLTMSEDNTVAYDIASAVDKLTGEDSIVQKAIDNVRKKKDTIAEEDDESASTTTSTSDSILTTMPIMGSFNEGFYDPLTAKPRRVPLEVVQYDRAFGRAKLSYESGFSSSMESSQKSTTMLKSLLSPVVERATNIPTLLTFDIPGLVAMNHPDKNLNGGSSEFFVLTNKDLKPDRVSLLNGQYAPFGYVVEGLDIMNNLQAGDIISSTYVNEWGKLNLKKIRGTSFADAISQTDEEDE